MKYIKVKLSFRKRNTILALGAQSKGSFCFLKKDKAYVCESFGDLSNMENFTDFHRHIKRIQDKIRVKPDMVACDLHPGYITSRYADEMVGGKAKGVQHHEAHVASCIVDNEIAGRVIGVVFDGTGFGSDGNIWGGEFFIGTPKKFQRAAHLKYIHMPGSEAAIRAPWRMAVSYLYNIYGPRFYSSAREFTNKVDAKSMEFITQVIDKKINSPLTSSMGRLFDAVAAIIGIRTTAEYEGQAAVELEKKLKAEGFPRLRSGQGRLKAEDGYNFKYNVKDGIIVIDWAPVIKGVVKDLRNKESSAEISLKFHNAVCRMVKDTCALLRKKYRVNKVCLSGGVFQNRYLTKQLGPLLGKSKFKVYFHKRLPAHDGNIALGQAVIAAER